MGVPDRFAIPCESALEEPNQLEGDEQLKLDLSRYIRSNQRVTHPPELAQGIKACSKLRALVTEIGDFIDGIVESTSKMASPRPLYKAKLPGKKVPFTQGNSRRAVETPKYDEELEKMGIKPIRFCPICLASMSWLPEYAACPSCGTRPEPQLQNELEEFGNLTADEIVENCLRKPDDNSEARKNSVAMRCSCKPAKLCAHCRVRGQLMGILRAPGEPAIKCTQPPCSRTQLDSVLSELKLIFNEKQLHSRQEFCKKYCLDGHLNIGTL